jgi:hypothetical protein
MQFWRSNESLITAIGNAYHHLTTHILIGLINSTRIKYFLPNISVVIIEMFVFVDSVAHFIFELRQDFFLRIKSRKNWTIVKFIN